MNAHKQGRNSDKGTGDLKRKLQKEGHPKEVGKGRFSDQKRRKYQDVGRKAMKRH